VLGTANVAEMGVEWLTGGLSASRVEGVGEGAPLAETAGPNESLTWACVGGVGAWVEGVGVTVLWDAIWGVH
jgi:hypothetical protein